MSRRDAKAAPTKKKVSCCGTATYHRHCVTCKTRLREGQRLFCGEVCGNRDRAARRRLNSIECWVEPIGSDGQWRRAWIPRSALRPGPVFRLRHRGRCEGSAPIRATQGQGS